MWREKQSFRIENSSEFAQENLSLTFLQTGHNFQRLWKSESRHLIQRSLNFFVVVNLWSYKLCSISKLILHAKNENSDILIFSISFLSAQVQIQFDFKLSSIVKVFLFVRLHKRACVYAYMGNTSKLCTFVFCVYVCVNERIIRLNPYLAVRELVDDFKLTGQFITYWLRFFRWIGWFRFSLLKFYRCKGKTFSCQTDFNILRSKLKLDSLLCSSSGLSHYNFRKFCQIFL